MEFLKFTDSNIENYIPYISGLSLKSSSGKNYVGVCPYCRDSGESIKHRKMYILISHRGVRVYCHKCQTNKSFYKFLGDHYPNLLDQAKKQFLKSGDFSNRRSKDEEKEEEIVVSYKNPKILEDLVYAKYSPFAEHYMTERCLPKWTLDAFLYSDNYQAFLKKHELIQYDVFLKKDQRVVIPFINQKNELTHIQGRSLDKNETLRYLTITLADGHPKVWGLNRIDVSQKIYITEGVFDAVYLKNSLAFGAANADPSFFKSLNIDVTNCIFCFDKDLSTNPNLRAAAEKYIKFGMGIFIFPKNTPKEVKDFNDMARLGKTEAEIQSFVEQNTYFGNVAKIQLAILSR